MSDLYLNGRYKFPVVDARQMLPVHLQAPTPICKFTHGLPTCDSHMCIKLPLSCTVVLLKIHKCVNWSWSY